jgi:hypothetical protein
MRHGRCRDYPAGILTRALSLDQGLTTTKRRVVMVLPRSSTNV